MRALQRRMGRLANARAAARRNMRDAERTCREARQRVIRENGALSAAGALELAEATRGESAARRDFARASEAFRDVEREFHAARALRSEMLRRLPEPERWSALSHAELGRMLRSVDRVPTLAWGWGLDPASPAQPDAWARLRWVLALFAQDEESRRRLRRIAARQTRQTREAGTGTVQA